MRISVSYNSSNFDRDKLEFKLGVIEDLLLEAEDFKVIAVRGVSGLLFGSILAYRMNKGLVVVRKPGESTHSGMVVEGCFPDVGEGWVIVDDLVATGGTVAEIIYRMGPSNLSGLRGVALYRVLVFYELYDLMNKGGSVWANINRSISRFQSEIRVFKDDPDGHVIELGTGPCLPK